MRQLLSEAIQYSFYKERIDQGTFNDLLNLDPSKTKKYARWIVEVYIKDPPNEGQEFLRNHSSEIKEELSEYDNFKNKKIIPEQYANIFFFKTFYQFLRYMRTNRKGFEQNVIEKNADKEVKILYKDKGTILLIPLTHAADSKWGRDSHWCTATSNESWYDKYSTGGTLYIRRFFDSKGALDENTGYQLYIPESLESEMNIVECRDMADDTIEDINDFYEGLPKELVEDIEERIDKAGGLNAQFIISGNFYGELNEEGYIEAMVTYRLERYGEGDIDTVDEGDDTTYSTVEFHKVGLQEEPNDHTYEVYEIENFNPECGIGIYVKYTSEYTPDEAKRNASNKWHQAERDERDDYAYELNQALNKLYTKRGLYDYVIVGGTQGSVGLDKDTVVLLEDHFDFSRTYEELDGKDSQGNNFYIYVMDGVDYHSLGRGSQRTSTAAQRAYDKQLDLDFEEEQRSKMFHVLPMRQLLSEAIQYSFYKEHIDQETFNALLGVDPTPTKKYARWIVETYIKTPNDHGYFDQGQGYLSDLLKLYDYLKNKNVIPQEYANIFVFKNFRDFIKYADKAFPELKDQVSLKQADKEIKILYRDKKNILLTPLTHAAAIKWGRDSHWCTSSANPRYFPIYSGGGTLYIHRWFDEKGALDEGIGYQLYIPNNDDSEMDKVECRDMRNDTIEDINDFYEDIPRDIAREIQEDVNERGGINAYTAIYGNIYGEMEDDHVRISVDYCLERIGEDDSQIIDNGDEETGSVVEVYRIDIDDDLVDTTAPLSELKDFDIRKGNGIFVHYTSSVSPEDAYENACSRWHQAERPDSVEDYEAQQALKHLLGQGNAYDYIIMPIDPENELEELDDDIVALLTPYFAFRSNTFIKGEGYAKQYDTFLETVNGQDYVIFALEGMDFKRVADVERTSYPAQRAYDKQLDLDFEEEQRSKMFHVLLH